MAGPRDAPRGLGAPRTALLWLLPLLGATLPAPAEAATTFLAAPRVRWAQDTGADAGAGNGVAVSRDGAWLFLTTRGGDLHVLATNSSGGDAAARWKYSPAVNDNNSNNGGGGAGKQAEASSSLVCRSGPALVAPPGGTGGAPYAVYAVQDTDAGTSDVLAVDAAAQLLWSVRLEGLAAGAPAVSARGNRVYVAHNLPDDNAGCVSVIGLVDPASPSAGAALLRTLTTVTRNGTDDADGATLPPLTAPTLRTLKADGGDGSGRVDVLLFAADDQAEPTQGGLYLLRAEPADNDSGDGDRIDLRLASEYPLSALARPALSRDARSAYLGQVGARVAGWDGSSSSSASDLGAVLDGSAVDVFPTWEQRLDESSSSSSDLLDNAIDTPPVLSSDETLLFITASVSGEPRVYALDVTDRGSVAWVDGIDDGDYADPVLAASDDGIEKLYLLERSGVLRQFHAVNGSVDWEIDLCEAEDGDSCGVAADFGVASTADTLYFVYSNGTVAALQVADLTTPAPTAAPGEAAPVTTPAPTHASTGPLRRTPMPTAAPQPSGPGGPSSADTISEKDESPVEEDGLGLPFILGTVCGGLVLLIAVTSYIACRLKVDGKKGYAGSKWKPEDLDEAYRKECEDAEMETLREIHNSATPPAVAPEVAVEEAPKPEPPVIQKAKLRWLRKANTATVSAQSQDEEHTHASSASPRDIEQYSVARAIDTQNDLCTDMKSKAQERKSKPTRSLSNNDEQSIGSDERPMSPVFISDLLSVDSSIYLDEISVTTDKFTVKPSSLLVSSIPMSERSRTSESVGSELSCPLDERIHSESNTVADDDGAASQGILRVETIKELVGLSDSNNEKSTCADATSYAVTHMVSEQAESAPPLASNVPKSSSAPTSATPAKFPTRPPPSKTSLPHGPYLDRDFNGTKQLNSLPNTEVKKPSNVFLTSAHPSAMQSRDSRTTLEQRGNWSETKDGAATYRDCFVNSTRPKAGIFTRNQKALPSSIDSTRETARHNGRSARQMPTSRSSAGNYLKEREARVICNPEPQRATNQSLRSRSETVSTRNLGGAKSDKRRRQTDPDGQKASETEGYNSTIYNAWSSFMSELAKAEEDFFNPKLGSQ